MIPKAELSPSPLPWTVSERRPTVLVITRKEQQRVKIGDDVWITVIHVGHGKVRIGIEAPAGVLILREELIKDQTKKGEDDAAR